jgi:hypothetical protein
MKYKLFGLLVCLIIGVCFPVWIMAADQEFKGQEYMGISFHYDRETDIIFRNSDYVDYDSRQLSFFTGRNIIDSWRMEYVLILAELRQHIDTKKKREMLYGVQTGLLYDFLQFDHFTFYTGLSVGVGYLRHASGYDELADENPFGLLKGRIGIDYKFSKKYFLRAQAGIWHISSIFKSDQGHNCWDYSVHIGYRF